MSKIKSIIDFSIILNCGYGADKECDFFSIHNHPALIKSFIKYVEQHKNMIGLTRIEDRQSIADSGCDVYIELRGTVKIGVQIKSQNDVNDANFSNKVKAQLAESLALGLDKYYILICSVINNKTEKKINYILSNMATYKTSYHAVLNPNNCVRIFHPGLKMVEQEFARQKQLYSEDENVQNIQSILQSIKKELGSYNKPSTDLGIAVRAAINRSKFSSISSADKFIKFLQLNKKTNPASVIAAINNFISKYGSLSDDFKSLYNLIIKESVESTSFIGAMEMNLHELESLLGISPSELISKIKILSSKKFELLRWDEDEPDVVNIYISLPGDYNFITELQTFCTENNIEFSDVLQGDFSLLD